MEEATELNNYLPLSFKTPSEQDYIAFLWEVFEEGLIGFGKDIEKSLLDMTSLFWFCTPFVGQRRTSRATSRQEHVLYCLLEMTS